MPYGLCRNSSWLGWNTVLVLGFRRLVVKRASVLRCAVVVEFSPHRHHLLVARSPCSRRVDRLPLVRRIESLGRVRDTLDMVCDLLS